MDKKFEPGRVISLYENDDEKYEENFCAGRSQ